MCSRPAAAAAGRHRRHGRRRHGSEVVYQVPWKVIDDGQRRGAGGLVVYWFPASENELKNSSLRNSRTLSLYATQCVTMGVADANARSGRSFSATRSCRSRSSRRRRQGHRQGAGRGRQAEGRAGREAARRRDEAARGGGQAAMNTAQGRRQEGRQGRRDRAVQGRPRSEVPVPEAGEGRGQRAEEARRRRRRAGAPAPDFDPANGAEIEKALKAGLMAENMEDYARRGEALRRARQMDPADPAPLRYLGELYRHQTGDWDKARVDVRGDPRDARRSAVARGRAARPRQDDDPRRRVPQGAAPDGGVAPRCFRWR